MGYNFVKERYGITGDTINISRELFNKILFLIRNYGSSFDSSYSFYKKIEEILKSNEDSYEISVEDFFRIEKEIDDYIKKPFYLGSNLQEREFYNPEFKRLTSPLFFDMVGYHEKLKELINLEFYNNLPYTSIKMDEEEFYKIILNVIDSLYEFRISEIKYEKFIDLLRSKESIVKSLNDFSDELVVNTFLTEFNNAVNENPIDIDKVQSIMEKAQKKILEHWGNSLTDVDSFESGKPFKFICHSMKGVRKFSGDFDTRYISTSLLSEEVMDVYNKGFGFIFDSKNIVGADSKDLYVNNNYQYDDVNVMLSVLPPIKSPETIIKECKERKEKEPDHRAYNEVIIDGFEPIGIFCLTDGSKKLNNNYNAAYELQKEFPNLKVIEIDQILYKKGPELYDVRKQLLTSIESRIGGFSKVDDMYASSFDLFWEKYLELKSSGNYTEEQIIELYKKNKELLFFIDESRLFDIYSDEELEVIFKYNYIFKIRYVLDGDYKFFCLEDVYSHLKKYAGDNRLDKYVPGLSSFLRLFTYTNNLTDEEKEEICKLHSFTDINLYIMNKKNSKFKERKEVEEVKPIIIKETNMEEYLNNNDEMIL